MVMLVSSVSGFSTYVSTSGSTLSITTNFGNPHWYSSINLAPGNYLAGVDLFDTNLTDADLSRTIWPNVVSQSDYDAVVAERDAALAAQATAETERVAALAAQASAEAERDAKLTLDEVKDLRAGSTMIEIDNGQATLSMEVEESDDLGVWTNESATSIQITKDAEAGKKFFRFKMAE